MTDKIQQARRELFEAWWLSEGLTLNDPTYGRYTTTTQSAWIGFNAALDCVVIELPSERKIRHLPTPDENHSYNEALENCRDAIESTNLGIKVK